MKRSSALSMSIALTTIVALAMVTISARAGLFGLGGQGGSLQADAYQAAEQAVAEQAAAAQLENVAPGTEYVTEYVYYDDGTYGPAPAGLTSGTAPNGQDEPIPSATGRHPTNDGSGPSPAATEDSDDDSQPASGPTKPPSVSSPTPTPRLTPAPTPGRTRTPGPTAPPEVHIVNPSTPRPTEAEEEHEQPPTAAPAATVRPRETEEPHGTPEPHETEEPHGTPEPHEHEDD